MHVQLSTVLLAFLIVSAFFLCNISLVHASLALDGSVTAANSGNTISLSLSTMIDNDVIIVEYSGSSGTLYTVSTVTSSPSLTFAKRKTISHTFVGPTVEDLEEWCVNWTSHGTLAITITLTGTPVDWGQGVAFGISGAVTTSSTFDSNAEANPSGFGANSANPHVSITTSNTNDFIIGLLATNGGTGSVGSGFTNIKTGLFYGSEYKIVSSTQSASSVGFTLWASQWLMIADAVMQASAPSGSWHSIAWIENLIVRQWASIFWIETLLTSQWHSILWQMILLVRDNSWDLGGALVGALIFFPMLIIGIAYIRRKK